MATNVKKNIQKEKKTVEIQKEIKAAEVQDEKTVSGFFQSVLKYFPDANGDTSKLYFEQGRSLNDYYCVRLQCADSNTYIELDDFFQLRMNENLYRYDCETLNNFNNNISDFPTRLALFQGFIWHMPESFWKEFVHGMLTPFCITTITPRQISFSRDNMSVERDIDKKFWFTMIKNTKQYRMEIPTSKGNVLVFEIVQQLNRQNEEDRGKMIDLQHGIAVRANKIHFLKTF